MQALLSVDAFSQTFGKPASTFVGQSGMSGVQSVLL